MFSSTSEIIISTMWIKHRNINSHSFTKIYIHTDSLYVRACVTYNDNINNNIYSKYKAKRTNKSNHEKYGNRNSKNYKILVINKAKLTLRLNRTYFCILWWTMMLLLCLFLSQTTNLTIFQKQSPGKNYLKPIRSKIVF